MATPVTDLISVPKGGGAVRGLGETFSPDLHTGAGAFAIPIQTPPGRSGLSPNLILSFSTGAGNGEFGFGWSLGVGSISRLTARGTPRYFDADPAQADIFLLNGAELVEVSRSPDEIRYQPRTEAAFSRIVRRLGPGGHWRVESKSGLVSLYGVVEGASGATPLVVDPDRPAAIFSWLLTETRDLFGNRITYDYIADGAQRLLKRARYIDLPREGPNRFLATVELLYDDEPGPLGVVPEVAARSRLDPVLNFRSGFEIRTSRRCKWLQVVSRPQVDTAIRISAYELIYQDEMTGRSSPPNGASLLARVNRIGFDDEGQSVQEFPALDLGYSGFAPGAQRFEVVGGREAPTVSLTTPGLELADLFGGGLPDVVELTGAGARYWRNLGGGVLDRPRPFPTAPAGVSLTDPGVRLIDADGDGRADLLQVSALQAGYYPLDFNGGFAPRSWRAYDARPSFSFDDPEVRLIDLSGDGVTDAVRSGQSAFECYFNHPAEGWTAKRTARIARQAAAVFPDVSFSDPRVKLASMSGGLDDIVHINRGRVDWWPSLGYGRFGARRTMTLPTGLPDGFDPQRLLLGDVDGDGVADLLHVEDRQVTLWINRAGASWSEPIVIRGTPSVSDITAVRLVDLYGSGVAGLLWTGDARGDGRPHHFFLDLIGSSKPYLLDRIDNNLGAVTEITYASSTTFYARDAASPETRWRTPLPFPVHVVAGVTVTDALSHGVATTEYRYRHGYWDGADREFRGFGLVEQLDSEVFDTLAARIDDPVARLAAQQTFSPPLLSRSWFHQGLECEVAGWSGDTAWLAPFSDLAGALAAMAAPVRREALRALQGAKLRTEVYALDGSPLEDRPYTVTEHAYGLREETPPDARAPPDRRRIFFPHVLAERTTQWERGEDPASQATLHGDYDAWGQSRRALAASCPRGWRPGMAAPGDGFLATLDVTEFASPAAGGPELRDRAMRTRRFEITSTAGARLEDIAGVALGGPSLKLIGATLSAYDGEAHVGLPLGQLGPYGVVTRAETLAMTDDDLTAAYGAQIPWPLSGTPPAGLPQAYLDATPPLGGYVRRAPAEGEAEAWFTVTASNRFDFHDAPDTAHGLLRATRNPLGHQSVVDYDAYHLLPERLTGPTGLMISADYDYRTFAPRLVTDENGGVTQARYSANGFPVEIFVRGRPGAAEGDIDAPGIATTYDLRAFQERGQAAYAHTTRRLMHDSDRDDQGAVVEQREYSDGFGRLLQTRTIDDRVRFGEPRFGGGAELLPASQDADLPAQASGKAVAEPVVVSGWKRYDNKGRTVEAFEPFRDEGWAYRAEQDSQRGRSARIVFDARGRAVSTIQPDGSAQLVVQGTPRDLADPPISPLDTGRYIPTPWEAFTYDANDNAGRTHATDQRLASFRHHCNTPGSVAVDALGRAVRSAVRTREAADPGAVTNALATRTAYDIQGRVLSVRDALGRQVIASLYDAAGRRLRIEEIDTGLQIQVVDALGSPLLQRDARGAETFTARDALGRVTHVWRRKDAASPLRLCERLIYDAEPGGGDPPEVRHLRGRLTRHYDEAGMIAVSAYDLAGLITDSTRRILSDEFLLAPLRAELAKADADRDWTRPPPSIDWDAPGAEDALGAAQRSIIAYDALGRIKWSDFPFSAGDIRYRLRPRYNNAGGLTAVDLQGPLAADETGPLQPFVRHIAYDAAGRRVLLVRDGIMTRYAYGPSTARLARMRTDRLASAGAGTDIIFTATADEPLADIAYTYDLAGNLIGLQDRTPGCGVAANPDAAGQTGTLRQRLAAGDALLRAFDYDPLYRLVCATGRESAAIASPRPGGDEPRAGFNSGRMGAADQDNMPSLSRLYREDYGHDPVGNLVSMRHSRRTPGVGLEPQWTRAFGAGGLTPEAWLAALDNHAAGGDWTGAPGDRMTHFEARAGAPTTTPGQTHAYDAAGNLLSEPGERTFGWDAANRLSDFRVQAGAARPSVQAFYLYDSAGVRRKKLVVRGERCRVTDYVGGAFERHRDQTLDGADLTEHAILHVVDGAERMATVRLGPAFDDDGAPDHPVQRHLHDHLGGTVLVISGDGAWLNREEYFPFGETSLGGFGRKRFRFTGKERDDESGLSYHEARYLNLATSRWLSTDPAGLTDGLNRYAYAGGSPLVYRDPSGLAADPSEVAKGNRILGKLNETANNTARSYLGEAPNFASPEAGPVITEAIKEAREDTQVWIKDGAPATPGTKGASAIDQVGLDKTLEDKARHLSKKTMAEARTDAGRIATQAETRVLNTGAPDRIDVTVYSQGKKVNSSAFKELVETAVEKHGLSDLVEVSVKGKDEVFSIVKVVKTKTAAMRSAIANIAESPRGARVIAKAAKAMSRGKKIIPVVGTLLVVGSWSSTAYAANSGMEAAARGDSDAAISNLGSAGGDVAEAVPGFGSVVAAGRTGFAVGELINEFIPEDVQNDIGGTIDEAVNHGWENMKSFYFGGG